MAPELPTSDPEIRLALAMQKFTMQIENLEKGIGEVTELRRSFNQLERIVNNIEVRIDSSQEREARNHELLEQRIGQLQQALDESNRQRSDDAQQFKAMMALQQESRDKAEERAAAMKKLIIGGIFGLITTFITAAAGVAIALAGPAG